MRKCFLTIIFLLSLLFFVSCHRNSIDYKGLLSSNQYEELYKAASESLNTKVSEEALYYKTAASYYLDKDSECSLLADLYLSMYSDNRSNVLKMVLYKGSLEKAYEAGKELYGSNNMSSSDKIQYFKILTRLEKIDEAKYLINEIEDILPPYDYAYAVINGKYTSSVILKALKKLLDDEGISMRYLVLAKTALEILQVRDYRELTNQFLATSFNGNPQYAQMIGDYFYNLNELDQAMSYWVYSKEMYPTAFEARMKMIRGPQSQI